ncbi:MAG: alpha/beta hydrolase fold domain-containing protein, partial [Flaviflexus sp.]
MSSSFRPDRWILAWVLQTRSRMTGASSFPLPSRPVEERQVTIPTRYGEMSGLIYRSPDAIAALHSRSTPPLHIQLHGGGVIGRAIREDEHVSRFLASETGAIILAPHFHAAPQVSFPVAEHQCFDALKWALSAGSMGWNPDRITVGGGGTGAKLAINTAQLASEGRIRLSGLIATTPVTDVSLPTPGAGA